MRWAGEANRANRGMGGGNPTLRVTVLVDWDDELDPRAIWSTIHAARREVGADFMATVWERLQPGSKEGYVSALKESLRVGRLWPPRRLLERTMLGIVRPGASEFGIKRLLSAVRLVEKTVRIKPLVCEADWLWSGRGGYPSPTTWRHIGIHRRNV